MKKQIFNCRVDSLEIHPEVLKFYQEKNLDTMNRLMTQFGQQQPITVVKKDNLSFIIDGVSRFETAKQIGLEEMICVEIESSDKEVLDHRIQINYKTKTSILEKCKEAEQVLGILGKSQGKKRETLGLNKADTKKEFGTAGKDRYQLTCDVLNLEMCPSNLRKLMSIYWSYNDNPNDIIKDVLTKLEAGKISIDGGYKLIQQKERKVQDKKERERIDYESKTIDVNYQLINSSSIDLSEIDDMTISLSIQSPPYFQLRKYRNQDELQHGQESTVAEYIENELKFYREIRKKLKENGVLIIIIGETYKDGYQGICTKLEVAMENDGWNIIDVNMWEKTNPKPQPHLDRFQPAYERIIVCNKTGTKPTFNDQKQPSSHADYKIIPTAKKKDGTTGFSIGAVEASITNVISTPCFNNSEFKKIDPGFKHDAPAPTKIYETLIKAYSNPGDTILDAFSGSGQGLVCALENGRNAIGYDVDPVSIEFSRKRLEKVLKERCSYNELVPAA